MFQIMSWNIYQLVERAVSIIASSSCKYRHLHGAQGSRQTVINQQLPAYIIHHTTSSHLSHDVLDTLKQTMREKGRVMRKRLQETQRRMPPQSPMPLLLPSSSAWRLGVTGVTILFIVTRDLNRTWQN